MFGDVSASLDLSIKQIDQYLLSLVALDLVFGFFQQVLVATNVGSDISMAYPVLVYSDRILVEGKKLLLVFEHAQRVGEPFGLRRKAALGGHLLSTYMFDTSFGGESGGDVEDLLVDG